MEYDIPKNEAQCRKKLREEFEKHSHIADIRVVDMLVVKGQMELVETVKMWKQKGHVMSYFKPTVNPKPADFLSKFLSGSNWMISLPSLGSAVYRNKWWWWKIHQLPRVLNGLWTITATLNWRSWFSVISENPVKTPFLEEGAWANQFFFNYTSQITHHIS